MGDADDHDRIVLRAGVAVAEVAPAIGGRLAQLDLGDGPLLRGAGPGIGWAHWGCYPLLPWSNRVPGGRLVVDGEAHLLPVNWEDGSAIHGLVASSPWRVRTVEADRVALDVDAAEGPYDVGGHLAYALDPDGLDLALAVENRGDRAVPVGLGIHPWLRAGAIRVPAAEAWPGEPLPTGPPAPVTPEEDLRRPVVPGTIDRLYTALTASDADAPGVRLSWSGPITQVVVYTGVPGWTCVEPVTMASDGFALAERGVPGTGVAPLAPGARLEVRYRFTRA